MQGYSMKSWLKKLPEEWSSVMIKYGFEQIGSGTTPSSQKSEFYDGDTPWVNTGELREKVIYATNKHVSEKALAEYSSLKLYPIETVLIAMYGATIGRVGILGVEATVNQAVCALAMPTKFDHKFAFYAIQASKDYLTSLAAGGGQPNLNAETLKNHYLPSPPLITQTRIATYLDRETTRIDALIAAKERLIKLLEEKRQALITHVVTKGLGSNVKMKPSGVEWLGDVPEGWEVKKIKFLGSIKYGLSQPPVYKKEGEGLALIRATNIHRGTIVKKGLVFVSELDIPSSKKVILKKGDIIVVRSGAYTADSALVTQKWVGSIAGFDMILKPDKEKVIPKFLAMLLLTSYVLEKQLIPMSARAAQPHLNAEELGHTEVLLPISLDEQGRIMEFLDKKLEIIRLIKFCTLRSMSLLKERRSALISAAVTGQIEIPES